MSEINNENLYNDQIWRDWLEKTIQPSSTVFDQNFYVTTAINYTNGSPHIGHAYEAITADVHARYHRIFGRNTYFLTGTDEHGQKIAQAAAAKNLQPIELCNQYCNEFQSLNKRLNISNDHFIRTTDPEHHKLAQFILQKSLDAGDIFLGAYSGWYNVREEAFVTENEAKINDYKDPASGLPLTKMEEESYFFKLSKFKEALVNHIKANPHFIQPDVQRDFILKRLEDDLHDLSISRTTFSWGIPLPNDPKHVMYVWFDALANYLTGVNWPSGEKTKFWPPNLQIVGKDITWFHCVIWPCMLLSAGIPLPQKVFGHGFIHDHLGRKMSKSLGNVIDPNEILNKYPSDSFRLSLIHSNPFGGDIPFSEETLVLIHNADLADTLGNLVNRCSVILSKNAKGLIPDVEIEEIFNLEDLKNETEKAFAASDIHSAYERAINSVKSINLYLTNTAPWKIKNEEDPNFITRNKILRSALEAIYLSAHFLSPFVPETASRVFASLSTAPKSISSLTGNKNLPVDTPISSFKFFKLGNSESKEERKQKAETAKNAKKDKINEQKAKNEQQNKKNNNNNKGGEEQHIFTKLDIRVGLVEKVWAHPDSAKLYCEQIDVGEPSVREIASGLQQKIPIDQFQGKKVLVICNLKAAKLAGFNSNGMVLCANAADGGKVELICPPENAKVGERIFLPNIDGPPATPAQVKNKKMWEAVAPHLVTDDNCVATFDGIPFTTSEGVCKSDTLTGSRIS